MTLIRNIKCFTNKSGMTNGIVHFTSDNHGETLSLEADGIQIAVRYKDVEKIVKRERAKGYKNGRYIIDETRKKSKEK